MAKKRRCSLWAALIHTRRLSIGCVVALVGSVVHGQGVPARATDMPPTVKTFFEQHCNDCHDADTKKGGLDLTALSFDPSDTTRFEHWVRIFDRVHDAEMPPKKKAQPSAKEVRAFLDAIGKPLRSAELSRQAEQGRVRGRRLTRIEYENTLHDLLGVEVPLQDLLPEDSYADGFATVASSQDVSNYLLEKYIAAADIALDAAFQGVLKPDPKWSKRWPGRELARRRGNGSNGISNRGAERRGEESVAWNTTTSFYGRMDVTEVPSDGWYRIRFRASAINPPKDGVVWGSLQSGRCQAKAPTLSWIGSFPTTVQPRDYEFEAWILQDDMLRLRPSDGTLHETPFKDIVSYDERAEKIGSIGIVIQSLSIERIERGLDSEILQQRLFGKLPIVNGAVVSNAPKADLEILIKAFADPAFRRPATDDELRPYVELAESALSAGVPFTDALRAGYRALLCSPRFLYFQEKPGKLDDYSIASRLSYLLWSTTPDDALRLAAEKGQLGSTQARFAQVERMLNDRRAAKFTADFLDQWLNLRDIEATQPDPKLYKEFDLVLQDSMIGETRSFFNELLTHDLSVLNFVQSDFTMLNGRLAKHYGISGVTGEEFQRVMLKPENHRGGVLSQASVLKVTANGTTTSPVLRGVWILQRLLGQAVPPPPPNVPAIEPDIRGATNIREQLAKHRSAETCAACHAKIDPGGFALENFDVIGGWRDSYRTSGKSKHPGQHVDASYVMPDGTPFQNIDSFKQVILKNPEQVARCLAEKLAVYGTGARISFADRPSIDEIMDRTKAKNYGLRSMLHALLDSAIFLNK